MNDRIECLKSRLCEKEELLEQMLLLLGEEQACIAGHDIEGIEFNRQRKLLLLDRLASKTSECKSALQSVAAELLISSPLKLSTVIAALQAPMRECLASMQQTLLQLGDAVIRSNRRNRDLLFGSLKAINSSLEFFNGSQGKSCTYGDTGRMAPSIVGGRLLSGEI